MTEVLTSGPLKAPVIRFIYVNHKGEERERTVRPHSLNFLTEPGYGYQPGWFLIGWDMEKQAYRQFRLSHIKLSHDISFCALFA